MRRFIGLTTKKKTALATRRNEMLTLIKSPYMNWLPRMVNERFEKSGTFAIAAINGVRISFTSAFTTDPKAAPITTPTAKSTTLPRSKNCLKSLSIRLD